MAASQALRDELLNDPLNLGYRLNPGAANNTYVNPAMTDAQAAALLNSTATGRAQKRADISPAEVWVAMDMADMPALPSNPNNAQLSAERRNLAWLGGLSCLPSIALLNPDGTDTQVKANLQAIFPAGTATRTRLLALATRPTSRAQELNLGAISEGDVAAARSGTW